MMQHKKLVCFDLDDTLIRGVNSVVLLCMLNGREAACAEIDRQEAEGLFDYKESDRRKALLVRGLPESGVEDGFARLTSPLQGIAETVQQLRQRGIASIVITVGPVQVARAAANTWGFDGYFGSVYGTEEGVFTGEITQYLPIENKVNCLLDWCERYGYGQEECVAVGDGITDIPLFACTGTSIAINPASEHVSRAASHTLYTDTLTDILPYIYSERI